MREIKAYQCDYCKKIYKTKSWMEKHEKECLLNPINKNCWLCAYKVEDMSSTDWSTFNHCSKLNKKVSEVCKSLDSRYRKDSTYIKCAATIQNCPYFKLK